MTFFMDEVIGNMTTILKRRGLWNDTLITFMSDNGGAMQSWVVFDDRLCFSGRHHQRSSSFFLTHASVFITRTGPSFIAGPAPSWVGMLTKLVLDTVLFRVIEIFIAHGMWSI